MSLRNILRKVFSSNIIDNNSHGNVFPNWDNSIHFEEEQQRMYRSDDLAIIITSISSDKSSVIISNAPEVYEVSLSHCTCEDFNKRNKPCKHMYKFAFFSGRMDPNYFYRGKGIIRNLDVNPITHNPEGTKNHNMSFNQYQIRATYTDTGYKRKTIVNATSIEDALNHLPYGYGHPVENIALLPYDAPTTRQLYLAIKLVIRIPKNICSKDISSLIEKAQALAEGRPFPIPHKDLINFALFNRISFSYYCNEQILIHEIFSGIPTPANYAFMVACADKAIYKRWFFNKWNYYYHVGTELASNTAFLDSLDRKGTFMGYEYDFPFWDYKRPSKNAVYYKEVLKYLQ